MRPTAIATTLTLLLVPMAGASIITGHVTADNHYALYTGSAEGDWMMFHGANERGPRGNPGRYNWSVAEYYQIQTDQPYLYLAAWSDDRVAQGVLADLRIDGQPLLSGDGRWEVFRTGRDRDDGDPPPGVAEVARQVRRAMRHGWDDIAVGGFNGVQPWGTIADISTDARWMWADARGHHDPFGPGGDRGEYLIFRTAVPEPWSAGLLVIGAVTWLLFRRR